MPSAVVMAALVCLASLASGQARDVVYHSDLHPVNIQPWTPTERSR